MFRIGVEGLRTKQPPSFPIRYLCSDLYVALFCGFALRMQPTSFAPVGSSSALLFAGNGRLLPLNDHPQAQDHTMTELQRVAEDSTDLFLLRFPAKTRFSFICGTFKFIGWLRASVSIKGLYTVNLHHSLQWPLSNPPRPAPCVLSVSANALLSIAGLRVSK